MLEKGIVGTNRPIGRGVDLGGQFIRLDWHTKKIVDSTKVPCPSGFDISNDRIYVASMSKNNIHVLDRDTLATIHVLSNPYFNDPHSVHQTNKGLLVASTGLDLIMEIDMTGKPLWEWWAIENGYPNNQFGEKRMLTKDVSHTDADYATLYHTTHVNSAIYVDKKENVCFASLFYQGTVISINKSTGETKTLLSGLKNPHAIYQIGANRFMVSDTNGNRVLLFDGEGQIIRELAGNFNWMQDARITSENTFLIADSNNHRIVEIDKKSRIVDEFRYPHEWKIYQVMEEPSSLIESSVCMGLVLLLC